MNIFEEAQKNVERESRRSTRRWSLDRALQLSITNGWHLEVGELTALAAEIETYVEAGK